MTPPCARVLTGGPVVDAVWRRLLDRAGPRPNVPRTEDPDLNLLFDGRRIDATFRSRGRYGFRLPAQPGKVVIVSRGGAPQELGLARDPRILGVALHRILLCQGAGVAIMAADDDRLADGFHAFEPDLDLRWTDGQAVIPAALFANFAGKLELELSVAGTALYLLLAEAA